MDDTKRTENTFAGFETAYSSFKSSFDTAKLARQTWDFFFVDGQI